MSHIIKPNDKIGILLSLATCAVFGLYPAASRAAYADGANIVFVLFITTFIRTLMLAVFCLIKRKPLFDTRTNRKLAFIGGFWQAISVIGIVSSLSFISGPLVLIIVFTHTLMLLFFMAFRGEIKLDFLTITATVAALAGLSLVLDLWKGQPVSNLIGMGLAFMAAVATTCRLYIFGHQMKNRNPAVVGAEVFLVTSALVLLMMLWQFPVSPETLAGWGWSFLGALSLGIGSFGMFYGIALMGSFRWSLFAKSEPIFTTLFSIWFLNEGLNISQYIGMAVVLGSLILYQIFSQRQKKKKSVLEI